ncbi:MAG: helix-turn-helix domain-containing protein [Candidatus Micrarchaeota archaeon]|nr:helix-turn-helix domain-containing protein [Candidatus Micrarchaeota archaeon]
MEKLKFEIAGEITLSKNPGSTMRKWREIFQISQIELAKHLKISSSTISDYESSRRKSPGAGVISRFVDALFEIDKSRGNIVLSKLSLPLNPEVEQYYETHEFASPFSGEDFAKLINSQVVANDELLKIKKVYGYTLVDSIKIIMEMPTDQYHKLYGSMAERAFIFTKVSTGRSPLVVIRVSPMKPSIVVLHGIEQVDELALKIAKKEQIPVLTTKLDLQKIRQTLNKF